MFRKQSVVASLAGAAALVVSSVVTAPPAVSVRGGTNWPTGPENNAVAWVNGCSGTLITPRIVLSAGHCFPSLPEPNPPLHPPYWQTNPDKINNKDWQQPGRFYSLSGATPSSADIRFGSNADSPVTTRIAREYAIFTNTDSILLRFTTPVPASQAIPAPVLTRTPGPDPAFWNSKIVTLVGNNSTKQNRSGTFKTRAANAAGCDPKLPNYICMDSQGSWSMVNGDSGGAGFWNDAAGQRWLISSNGIGKAIEDPSPGGSAMNVRTSHRGAETADSIFPDQQIYFDRIVGAADIAFTQVNDAGTPYSGATQVAQGRSASVTHPSTGMYNVVLPKVLGTNTVIVSPQGTTGAFCQSRSAGGPSNLVECFDKNGARVDTGFSILSTSRWADARATVQLSGTTATVLNGAAPGAANKPTVTRSSEGRYTVTFGGMVGSIGNVQVAALQGSGKPVKCNTAGWGSNSVNVVCSSPTVNGVDHGFSVVGARKDALEKRSDMFAWADQATTAGPYAVSAGYAQQNGGTPTSERLGTGHYRIRFLGAQNTFNGVWVATAYGLTGAHCGINPANFLAEVRCVNRIGTPVDVRYSVRYLKPAN